MAAFRTFSTPSPSEFISIAYKTALRTALFSAAYFAENSQKRPSYPSKPEAIWFDDALEPVPPESPKGASPYPHRIRTVSTP